MGQVTIYLDPETENKMLNMIEKSGISKSKWIAELIREKTANAWPENVKKLAGAWEDLPMAEEIRKDMANDAERESI
ncbi:MAG: CopG family transcriptional regulator [Deltaproteobacteria bacterium]|nr:CopG family transcriptional regulator [Deltaproteobacteria bacterium]